jgi:putative membrane-bound dehydrogenase-like protein
MAQARLEWHHRTRIVNSPDIPPMRNGSPPRAPRRLARACVLLILLAALKSTPEGVAGTTPAEALGAIHTRPELVVELAAAEPLIADPVAIDWDARGRLWVVEQADYPNGIDGNWKPGGRVKILTDRDGDGRYDQASLFLEGLPFPTGITCWRGGALVCAAPDILYAEDTDGDGKADVVKKLFTGFNTTNYNARINSLALGLDNWMHGANGLLGGKIRSEKTGAELDIAGRDIRIRPDTGEIELVPGRTQQGRARDDWDNWFGCSNGRFIFHFPMPEHYLRRNPHVTAPESSVYVPAEENSGKLNPVSRALDRFNHPEALGQITSACGLGIYRDVLLGGEFYGNAFTGEVAHNLVRRYQLLPDGVTFSGHRPKDEQSVEFFASEDNWARAVQIRTGPDGALYVVDMVRAVIEHTRWIPADKLANLDVRAGDTMGRIYRIYPRGAKLRPVRDLTALSTAELAAALETPNGTTRDLVHLQLLHRADSAAAEPLEKLERSSPLPAVRVQALCALDGLHQLDAGLIQSALADAHAGVRRQAVRLSEGLLAKEPELAASCLKLASDPELTVRYQLALSLGEWDDPRASDTLAALARSALEDKWMRAAVLSSSARQPMRVLRAVLAGGETGAGRDLLIGQLIATAAAEAKGVAEFAPLLEVLVPPGGAEAQSWQWSGLAQLLAALDRRNLALAALPGVERTPQLFAAAHAVAMNPQADEGERETALKLFCRDASTMDSDLSTLATFLKPGTSERVQKAALAALARTRSPRTVDLLVADWSARGPAQRLAIIQTLLSRDEWTAKLLDAIAAGTVAPGDVPLASRQALSRHANAELRQRAAELLPARPSGDRVAIVAKYQSVATLHPDGAKGAAVFANVCSTCHSYLGRGHDLGPNLSSFRDKAAQDWVTAILDPNAAIEPRFTLYELKTKDGRALAGVITSETATSLVLGLPGGVRETLLRSDLAEIRASNLSLMPEGLEAALTPQDIADLIAFIKGGG